jgi:hypothetical protein
VAGGIPTVDTLIGAKGRCGVLRFGVIHHRHTYAKPSLSCVTNNYGGANVSFQVLSSYVESSENYLFAPLSDVSPPCRPHLARVACRAASDVDTQGLCRPALIPYASFAIWADRSTDRYLQLTPVASTIDWPAPYQLRYLCIMGNAAVVGHPCLPPGTDARISEPRNKYNTVWCNRRLVNPHGDQITCPLRYPPNKPSQTAQPSDSPHQPDLYFTYGSSFSTECSRIERNP